MYSLVRTLSARTHKGVMKILKYAELQTTSLQDSYECVFEEWLNAHVISIINLMSLLKQALQKENLTL